MSIRSFTNGLVAGVILGILFAPASGRETRRKLAKKANEIEEAAQDITNNAVDAAPVELTVIIAAADEPTTDAVT